MDKIEKILSGMSLRQVVMEALEEDTDLEERKVTFNGKVFPPYGICCVLAGGSGSGKGFMSNTQLLADFRVFDVDKLKSFYLTAQKAGVIDDTNDYSLTNPDDVSKLHANIKDLGWDKKWEKHFFSYLDKNKLPNILFDMTGKDTKKLSRIADMANGVGYHTSFVWVVSPRNVAIIQNLTRKRSVTQNVFHSVHNAIYDNIFPFLKSNACKGFDEAWIVVNLGKDKDALPDRIQELGNEYSVIQLEKSGDSFKVPDKIIDAIYEILGPKDDPENPKVYKDFDTIDTKQGIKNVYK